MANFAEICDSFSIVRESTRNQEWARQQNFIKKVHERTIRENNR